jgi:bacterial/archaeal transporter family-2 protein
MKYLLMFLTLIVGALIPVQAILNSRLGRLTGGPLMGSLLSFLTGLLFLIVLNLFANPSALVQVRPSTTQPWFIWLGGFLGAIFVGYITWVNQRQGLALTFALVVSGQIFVSLVMDHYGLLGSAIRAITLEKVAGAVLIIIGLVLIKK